MDDKRNSSHLTGLLFNFVKPLIILILILSIGVMKRNFGIELIGFLEAAVLHSSPEAIVTEDGSYTITFYASKILARFEAVRVTIDGKVCANCCQPLQQLPPKRYEVSHAVPQPGKYSVNYTIELLQTPCD